MKKRFVLFLLPIVLFVCIAFGLVYLTAKDRQQLSDVPIMDHVDRTEKALITDRLTRLLKDPRYMALSEDERRDMLESQLFYMEKNSTEYAGYPILQKHTIDNDDYLLQTANGDLIELSFGSDLLSFEQETISDEVQPEEYVEMQLRELIYSSDFIKGSTKERRSMIMSYIEKGDLPIDKDSIETTDGEIIFESENGYLFRVRFNDIETILFSPEGR